MQTMIRATNAYQQAATHRSIREQEADIFRHAIAALRTARGADKMTRARAVADNRRLWLTVHDLMSDPGNALPPELRASIVSVGISVRREMEGENPDFGFLISINEHMAAGLGSQD
ncbi:MAG TPA: flagellar biosynthesis regulator FlaF [Acetobacteraceae bacterium]